MLKIRRISSQEKQLKIWQQCYSVNTQIKPANRSIGYFQLSLVSETQKINALVVVESWCHYRWPKLVHYAWSSLSNNQLCELFASEYIGITFFSQNFRCESVEIVDDMRINYQPWLIVKEASLGEVLLAEPIESLEKKQGTNQIFDHLKLRADWILGYSYISAKLLQTIELRDVLSIQQLQLNMSVAGQVLARFQKQDEGLLMIEELVAPESEEEFVFPEEDEMQEIVRPFNVKEMNIKLTFVLGHSDITVDELSKMEPGYIYSIGENKEREVKVYANKQLIAEGELIYIGNSDELGLEITHVVSLGDKRV
ncbi:FliM/FliN family flagellar motor switch protein [Providencia hangzhouensis]|uniref:FliM/FliN family flagellar motor switch protein n=1 Tax=Providencia rettgeri TaxID=587 RepID=A0AAJ4TIG4_PRORE|nr:MULTISPECIES: FliM/FliN family flagellar motor switch protein [Providencia]MBJ9971353.1 FliM/FliN family flagellar motor switch protein [Providencia rettgeri]MBQ0529170.1 FliM/FliN family flagellar motor switch protein [Providencia rettgeri]MCF8962828.1 Surface presentation of antigens protein SpaO [Providencia rettgeri]MDB9567988.1 FliM/FliN family flagellar motor switch protein [Providencia rettgeri]QWQ17132.1 FliM/FliN family flagellar motor switch protein [Providencia rettgeri]